MPSIHLPFSGKSLWFPSGNPTPILSFHAALVTYRGGRHVRCTWTSMISSSRPQCLAQRLACGQSGPYQNQSRVTPELLGTRFCLMRLQTARIYIWSCWATMCPQREPSKEWIGTNPEVADLRVKTDGPLSSSSEHPGRLFKLEEPIKSFFCMSRFGIGFWHWPSRESWKI